MIPAGPYMDMHTHILPGVDDGSQSIEQTAAMLRQAYDEGIRVIVATPHFGVRNPDITVAKAKNALAVAQKKADEITPGIKIVLGSELFYSDGIIESLERGDSPAMAGTSYALVEFSTRESKDRIERCIREMTWKGFRPIIAHIERYQSLEGDVAAVESLVSQGAAIQINCRSFMDGAHISTSSYANHEQKKGIFGRLSRSESISNRTGFFLERKGDWARELLSRGLVHFIASDCHDETHRSPVYRSALKAMEGYCNEEMLNDIAKNNIVKLIRNEPVV